MASESEGGAFNRSSQYVMRSQGGVRPAVHTLSISAAIPVFTGTVKITKATAALCGIVAPTAAQDGTTLVITSATDAAHTVTGVALIADGVTGSPHSTATFAAFKGATITLMACNQLWNVVSSTGVTVA